MRDAGLRLLTDGKGIYCTTQQEDNATLNALTRAAQSGLVDLQTSGGVAQRL